MLILLGTVIRLVLPFYRNPLDRLTSDPLRHWVNGQQFFSPELMGGSDPIVYQIFVRIVQETSHGNALLFAAISGLLSAVMPWLFYRAAKEFGMNRCRALITWAILALMPSLFVIYNYVMMETLLLPFVGLGLWLSARHLRKRTLAAYGFSCAVWVLACLTKPTVLPLAAICLLWTGWVAPGRWKSTLVLAFIGAVMLAPTAIRTKSTLGFFAPLGNPWITKIQHRSGARKIEIHFGRENWNFVSPSCNMIPLAPLSPWRIRRGTEDSTIVVHADTLSGEAGWRRAYDELSLDAGEWLAQWGENIVLFLFAPSWPDCNMDEWDGWLCVALRWLWAPLIFYVMDINIRDLLRRRFELLPVATTLFTAFLMFQNVATSEGRYRKPLEPLLIMNLLWVGGISKEQKLYKVRKRNCSKIKPQ